MNQRATERDFTSSLKLDEKKCDEERNFIMPHQMESIYAMIHSRRKINTYTHTTDSK